VGTIFSSLSATTERDGDIFVYLNWIPKVVTAADPFRITLQPTLLLELTSQTQQRFPVSSMNGAS